MNDLHGILFAYRSNANLGELTRPRNTCSLPFGGRYRLIDFMLSSYVNAGITDVGLVVHESYQSLLDHLGTGKDWDLSRKHGGLRILPPFGYQGKGGGEYRGNMEALAGVAGYLQNIRQDYVIMGWGDIAVNLPVAQVLEQHIASGADVTMVCTPTLKGAPQFSEYVEVSGEGRITDLSIHPTTADQALESLDAFQPNLFPPCRETGGISLTFPQCRLFWFKHYLQPLTLITVSYTHLAQQAQGSRCGFGNHIGNAVPVLILGNHIRTYFGISQIVHSSKGCLLYTSRCV